MGEIFLARMRGAAGFEKRVIIKTILPHLAEEEEFVEKFLDEGRIVVQLTHGNIVPVFDMGEENGEFFIAMEYIPGRDLRDLIKHKQVSQETIDLPIALHIIAEVCKGLGYAHRKTDEAGQHLELVHRDVSPSNVLISSEGEVKLIDFGIASATTRLSRTVSGRIQGKFSYMSPEQASGKLVDARSDIFSTGVMLYEMLTGIRPFDGCTDLETIDFVRRCEFDPPSTLQPHIPPEVDAIIERALCKDLEDRYQSIDTMQSDILGYLYREGCAPTSIQVVDYLRNTFSDQIERSELRLGTPSTSSLHQSGPKRLDDILEAELLRLSDPNKKADPFTQTDISLKRQAPQHTATLVTDNAPPTPRVIDEPARIVTPTPTKSSTQDVEKEHISTEDPSTQSEGNPGEEIEQPVVNELVTEDETPLPTRDEEAPTQSQLNPRVPVILSILLFATLIAGLFIWNKSKNTPGKLKITTSPEGAQLLLDGAPVHNAKTPLQVDISPGWHEVELQHQGFEPYKMRLNIRASEELYLENGEIKLQPVENTSEKQHNRAISIQTNPPGALILVDGKELGPAPQNVQLSREQPVIVYAQKQGCEDADITLSHNYVGNSYTISMLCQTKQPTLVADVDKPSPSPKPQILNRPTKIPVTLRVEPRDAIITVNGSSASGIYTNKIDGNKRLNIKAFKKGFKPFQTSTLASKLRNGTMSITLEPDESKCINLRLMEIQMADDVLVDGKSIGPVKSSRRGIQVGPGKHSIKAINKIAQREDSTTIIIPDNATSCVNAVLFPLK